MGRMKRDRKQPKQNRKLALAKESVRSLSAPDLSNVAGGRNALHDAKTVTFPRCCRTA